MNGKPLGPPGRSRQVGLAPAQLAALSRVDFGDYDTDGIFQVATVAVGNLSTCQVEASYRSLDGEFVRFPRSQPEYPEIDRQLREFGSGGQIDVGRGQWGWAIPMNHQSIVQGCLVVSAADAPPEFQVLLLKILAQQAGTALAYVAVQERDIGVAEQTAQVTTDLHETNQALASTVSRLQRQSNIHEVLGAAVAAGRGAQGVADALYDLTALPVGVEDRFGNLRCWAGSGRPHPYPKQTSDERELLLHELAARNGPARIGGRMLALVQPRAEILGVLALHDPDNTVSEDSLFALRYGTTVLAMELSHERSIAEIELNLRRDLVDDLLVGTDRDGAYARADALGHDLRRPHYVVVMNAAGRADCTLATAAGRAATALHLNYLQGQHGGFVVLLTDGRPDPGALHHAIGEGPDRASVVIGIGTRCDVPDELPQSFIEARRAFNIQLRSANPGGAAAFDELGFYRLIDGAHDGGAVEPFVREWLGALLDYDSSRKSEMVLTLSEYLECGGNYDESAAALHIHRSTLRYRLARIAELTGYDLRDVDTRFNLHAATRAWRFLNPAG